MKPVYFFNSALTRQILQPVPDNSVVVFEQSPRGIDELRKDNEKLINKIIELQAALKHSDKMAKLYCALGLIGSVASLFIGKYLL